MSWPEAVVLVAFIGAVTVTVWGVLGLPWRSGSATVSKTGEREAPNLGQGK